MRVRVLAMLLCVLAGLPARAGEPPAFEAPHFADHPLAGRIWSVAEGRFVAPEALAAAAAAADFVLLGEIHTNPDHHALQAWVVGELVAAGRRPAIVFEMISRDAQDRIDAHLEVAPLDAAGFGAAVGWPASDWPDWTIYQPILEKALPAGVPVRAGAPVPERRRSVGQRGLSALGSGERTRLGLDAEPDTAATRVTRAELEEGHCGLLPQAAIGPMEAVQRFRDATLADSLIEAAESAPADGGAVLIAGAGHVRADTAVPVYLSHRVPGAQVLPVAFVEVVPGRAEAADYLPQGAGDTVPYAFLWFTPRASVEDPCAALRERFNRKKE